MIELIKIIFFSKVILLVNGFSGNSIDIVASEKLTAINEGAHFTIDVSEMMADYQSLGSVYKIQKLKEKFEHGGMTLCTLNNKSDQVCFDQLSYGVSGTSMYVYLSTTSKNLLSARFDEMKLNSQIELKNVHISWINHTK